MHFIAYSIKTRIIWGCGDAPLRAWEDAQDNWRAYANSPDDFRKEIAVAPATYDLVLRTDGNGGVEGTNNWEFEDGVADLTLDYKEEVENLNRYLDALNKND